MKIIINICRILVGSLFIVSGLIKANDAWGFYYKLEEYFQPGAFNMEFMNDYALGLAIFVCIAEVLLGVAILTGAKAKLTMVLTMVMMLCFTWLTYYTSTCDPLGTTEIVNSAGEVEEIANQCVLECGCFGNAIPLEPWESFLKDLFILIFSIPILIGAFTNKIQLNTAREDILIYGVSMAIVAWFSLAMLDWLFPVAFTFICIAVASILKRRVNGPAKEWVIAIGITVVCSVFQWYTLSHLPIKDYRPYAEGENLLNNMKSAEELGLKAPVYATEYAIKHLSSGKDSIIYSNDWLQQYKEPWFKDNWEVVSYDGPSILIEEGYEPRILDFQIVDYEGGDDLKESILEDPGYKFMHVSNTLADSHSCGQEELNALAAQAENKGIMFFALTNALYEEADEYRHEHQAAYPFYNCDQTELKIIVRSNPGLVLLKGATVVKKWAWRDFPEWSEVEALME